MFESYLKLQATAVEELTMREEQDDGDTEYKLKFDAPTMAKVGRLTTQMAFRLNEGNGTAYYQIGVLDSGQVTGLKEEEILETLLVLYHISTTLAPPADLTIHRVRRGQEGFSCMLRVVREHVSTAKNFTKELNKIQKSHGLFNSDFSEDDDVSTAKEKPP